jgi:hypothetical protein
MLLSKSLHRSIVLDSLPQIGVGNGIVGSDEGSFDHRREVVFLVPTDRHRIHPLKSTQMMGKSRSVPAHEEV